MVSLVQEPKQYGPPPKSLAEATVVPFKSYSSAERWGLHSPCWRFWRCTN